MHITKEENIEDVFAQVIKSSKRDEYKQKAMRQYISKNISLEMKLASISIVR